MDFMRALATFQRGRGLRRKAECSSTSLMVANEIHRGKVGCIKGDGRGGLRDLRAWELVSTTMRSAAAGSERGNVHLP